MPTTVEDRLVVGDVSVVADLYRQHGAFIHTISQKLVGAAADRLTQQVFAEAWRDRLEFNPSLGTIRNWLVRRARQRVSKPSTGADSAVDRLVVADSLQRMDPLRREVVLAGYDATDAEELARRLDQPVATVRGHLRRGRDLLRSDLADSRPDGDDASLAEIMATGPPDLELVTPPEVTWQAIAAELNLDTGAVTGDDFLDQGLEPVEGEDPTDNGDSPPVDVGESATGSEDRAAPDRVDGAVSTDTLSTADPVAETGIDQLRAVAEAADAGRSKWVAPVVIVIALVVLVVVILTAF